MCLQYVVSYKTAYILMGKRLIFWHGTKKKSPLCVINSYFPFISNLFKSLKCGTVFMAKINPLSKISLTWFYNRHFFTSKHSHLLKRYQYRLNRKTTVILSHPLINRVPRNYPMLSDWPRCPLRIVGATINSCSLVVSVEVFKTGKSSRLGSLLVNFESYSCST